MGRRNVSMMRLGRCVAFLAAAAFLLPFTILLMVADQQYNLTYNSKRVFYQEVDRQESGVDSQETQAKGDEGTRKAKHIKKQVLPGTTYKSEYFESLLEVGFPQVDRQESGVGSQETQAKVYMYENGTNDDGLLTRDKFMEVNARMEARRRFLKNECSRLGLDSSRNKAYAWEYLINRQYHVIWCNIFKAASTSWMYNFNLMANYTAAFLDKTKEVPLGLARKKYARPSVEMVKKAQIDSISFLIVRHPLERLASAYNDKIAHAWPKSFHDKMGYRIIKKYRKKTSPGMPNAAHPMFEEFVSYVLDEARAKRTLDMHWTPYTDFCTPCKFDFDVVLKFETLDEDQRYLIQLARLQDVVKPEWRNSGKGKTQQNINHLYSRLRRQQLIGLYNLYKYDFQLFNYTIESYFEIVQPDDPTHG